MDKVEFIVMGGTFLSMDPEYRDYFIRRCVRMCTCARAPGRRRGPRQGRDGGKGGVRRAPDACTLGQRVRVWLVVVACSLHDALSGHTSNSVEEAIAYSEQSNTKCIAITIETRPDYCLKPHLNSMLQVDYALPCLVLLCRARQCLFAG